MNLDAVSECGIAPPKKVVRVYDGCAFGIDDIVIRFVEERIGYRLGPAVAIGAVSTSGALLGGVVYHNYVNSNVCKSIMVGIAGEPGWLTPRRLRLMLGYPFNQLGCDRVDAVISEDKARSRKLCEGLGFEMVGRFPRQFKPRDGIIYSLLQESLPHVADNIRRLMREKSSA